MRLFQRTYSERGSSELVEVGYNAIDFYKGTLLCLPGQWAIGEPVKTELPDMDRYQREMLGINLKTYNESDVKKHISGFLRTAERMLGGENIILEKGVKLISVSYRDNLDNDLTSEMMRTYNRGVQYKEGLKKDPDNFFSSEAAENAFHAILPLISKNNKITFSQSDGQPLFQVKGQPLPIETVCENLSKVNLLAFSYGGIHAAMMNNALKKFMGDLGFEDKDIRKALGNVNLLSLAAPMVSQGNNSLYFKTVLFEGINDKVVSDFIPNYESTLSKEKKTPYLEKISDNLLRVVMSNPTKIEFIRYNTKDEYGNPDLKIGETYDPDKHHRLRFYTSYRISADDENPTSNIPSIMAENCLNNMFSRIPVKDITDLLKYAETSVDPTKNRFRPLRKMYNPLIEKIIKSDTQILER